MIRGKLAFHAFDETYRPPDTRVLVDSIARVYLAVRFVLHRFDCAVVHYTWVSPAGKPHDYARFGNNGGSILAGEGFVCFGLE